MTNLKDKTVCIVDDGMNVWLSERLARDFGRTLLFTPWVSDYPRSQDDRIGTGIPGVERISYFWNYIDEIDLFIFPGLFHGDMQEHLVDLGKRVWGSRFCDKLELDRWEANKKFERLGELRPEMTRIKGIDNLREHLKENDDLYIKISTYRADDETWHHQNYAESEEKLDEIEQKLGKQKHDYEWLAEKPIKGDDIVETGWDGICIDGQFSQKTIQGFEIKDCYDDKTEILTNEGWKLFKDLNKTEDVLTLNMSDKRHIKFEYQKPTDYIKRTYNGDLVYIEKDSVSLCITPTHNVLVRETYQLENGETLNWNGFDGKAVTFKRGVKSLALKPINELIAKNRSFQLFQPTGMFLSKNPSKYKIKIGNKLIFKGDFAEFLGWFLSEGYVRKNGNGVHITQYKYVNQLEVCLNKLPYKFNRDKKGFSCYDKGLADYLRPFGYSIDKFIPDWIKDSSFIIINRFLNAFCYGDGTFTKNYKKIRKDSTLAKIIPGLLKEKQSRCYYTTSKRLRDDLQELTIKLGNVSVWYNQPPYFDKTKGVMKERFFIQEKLINRKNHIFPNDIQYMPYNGDVYCVTVPNHVIMIRRNGKAMWCGNCCFGAHVVDYKKQSPLITSFNDAISETLKRGRYRNFMSTEIRVGKDKKPIMIDFTARIPSPPGELFAELCTNLSQVMWHGAEGVLIEPEFEAKYGVEVFIDSSFAENKWQSVRFPEKIKRWVKLRNYAIIDGVYCVIPKYKDFDNVGSVVAIGNTLEECFEKVKDYSDQISGHKIEKSLGSIEQLKKVIEKAKAIGINF